MKEMPLRRMRIKYLGWHNPKVWSVGFEPPGLVTCYDHYPSLGAAMKAVEEYFIGRGIIKSLLVQSHLMKHCRPTELFVGVADQCKNNR